MTAIQNNSPESESGNGQETEPVAAQVPVEWKKELERMAASRQVESEERVYVSDLLREALVAAYDLEEN